MISVTRSPAYSLCGTTTGLLAVQLSWGPWEQLQLEQL